MRHPYFFMAFLCCGNLWAQIHVNQSVDLFPNKLEGWTKNQNAIVDFGQDEISIAAKGGDASLLSTSEYTDFILQGACYLDGKTRGAFKFRLQQTPQLSNKSVEYIVSFDHFADQQNPTGSIVDVARGTWIPSFDTAGWFDFEISALADQLSIKMNGKVISQTFDRRSTEGHLQFEVPQNGELRFRNLKVAEVQGIDPGIDIRSHFNSHPNVSFEHIFDGKTTNGWTSKGDASWTVNNGILHGYSGEKGGFLISDGSYKDFHLVLDFKIIKGDNSGIFIRRPADAQEVTLQNSVECNIYDHNGYEHVYSTGSLATHARAWSNLISYKNWNTAEILAWNDQIAMYINGIKASHVSLPAFDQSGNICLQGGIKIFSEDKGPSDIYFRNIRIRSLD